MIHLQNIKLLEQFISPYSEEILPSIKTGICKKQYKKLLVEVAIARDYGEIIFNAILKVFLGLNIRFGNSDTLTFSSCRFPWRNSAIPKIHKKRLWIKKLKFTICVYNLFVHLNNLIVNIMIQEAQTLFRVHTRCWLLAWWEKHELCPFPPQWILAIILEKREEKRVLNNNIKKMIRKH